ncbi:MAG: 4-hydroxy-tetrahydrodipicolinate synthase [Candidatus Omnitrophica bacterium]|nr:4-hydroxy-tetrahydrodipicolinate synthase [Candidatus Omnitrophota bacterium]
MFKGSIVAIVTPFKNGQVDETKLAELVEFHIKNGTNAILPCGTTGESPTLTPKEHERVIEACIEASNKKIPILAGTGSNSTAEAIELTQRAAKAGADASLQVTPYYNKPMQEGLYQHFKAVANSVNIPIILYNIAGRTARNIEPETIARLAKDCKNIIGVKEASGSLDQTSAIRLLCPDNFLIFSGDDALTLPTMSVGGVGVISVVANIVPQETAKLCAAIEKGDLKAAQEIHYKLLPLVKAMFIETNPIPIKTAMGLLGMCSDELRLPLSPMAAGNVEKLKIALKNYGLLK